MIPLNSIFENPDNPREIEDGRYGLLKKSLLLFPRMLKLRPIVIDQDNIVRAGNMRRRAILEISLMDESQVDNILAELKKDQPERYEFNREFWTAVREGKALPDWAVKKAENFSEEELREFVIRDNIELGQWDWDSLANEWEKGELADWGLDLPEDWGADGDEVDDGMYTRKIEAPVYEPKNEKPGISELVNCEKAESLIEKIDAAEIPDEEKEFLRKAAQRHMVFNYENIADYYAHPEKEVQELMEDSALVIIDFDKAIEDGFVKLSGELADQYMDDYGKEA